MPGTPGERRSHGPWAKPQERAECPCCGADISSWFGVPRAPVSYLDLTLDPDAYRVFVGEREVPMTPRHCSILSILAKLAGYPISRTQLLNRLGLWDIGPETMDVHVSHLRQRLIERGSQATVLSRRGEYGGGDGPLWSLGARQ